MGRYFATHQLLTPDTHPALHPEFQAPDELQAASAAPERSLPFSLRKFLFKSLALGGGAISSERIDGRSLRRVLVLRYDAIGDYLVSTALLHWLHSALPGLSIDVLASRRNQSTLMIDPYVRHTAAVSPEGDFTAACRIAYSLRHNDYDAVIAPIHSDLSKAAILTKLAAPRARSIAFEHRGRSEVYGQFFTRQIARQRWREHIISSMTRLVTESIDCGQASSLPETPMPYLTLRAEDLRRVHQFLRQQQLRFAGLAAQIHIVPDTDESLRSSAGEFPYAVVNIASHSPLKHWAIENWQQVCAHLLQRYPRMRLLVSGAPDSSDRATAICNAVNNNRCTPINFSLGEFMALVAGSSLLLSVDSAPVHVAAFASRPVAALYARFQSACEWYPWKVPWSLVLSAEENSLSDIPASLMIEALAVLSDSQAFSGE